MSDYEQMYKEQKEDLDKTLESLTKAGGGKLPMVMYFDTLANNWRVNIAEHGFRDLISPCITLQLNMLMAVQGKINAEDEEENLEPYLVTLLMGTSLMLEKLTEVTDEEMTKETLALIASFKKSLLDYRSALEEAHVK